MASNEGSQPDVRIDFGAGSTTPFPPRVEPFMTFPRHPKRPAVSKYASRTLVQRPPALRRQLLRVASAPAPRRSPCLTSRPTFVTLRRWKHAFGFRLPANAPEGQKRFPISSPKAISYQSVSTALRDELGLEYLRQTVANDVDEANVLQAFNDNNRERLAKTSHNLKSVSGLIGMQETSALAAKIQDDCPNGQHDGLKDTVEKLQQVAANESQEVRKIASTLPER